MSGVVGMATISDRLSAPDGAVRGVRAWARAPMVGV